MNILNAPPAPPADEARLYALLKYGPELDEIEAQLPEGKRWLAGLQRRAADNYASGSWQISATGETFSIHEAPHPSAMMRVQTKLGGVLTHTKSAMQTAMHGLGLGGRGRS